MSDAPDRDMLDWTHENLTNARSIVARLLEDLRLDAYLFGVEPTGDHWEVRLEYAIDCGWKTALLSIDDRALFAAGADGDARRDVLAAWDRALDDAKRARASA